MTVHGAAKVRFAAIREAFENNLESGLDQGAAFAVVYQGHVVVDLWGGHADAVGATPWTRDTLVNVWSTTKGVASLAIAMLVDRDKLDYEAPVADYWPEFAANGKQDVTLGCLMSHQAGLPGSDQPTTLEDIYDWHPFADGLAAMAPLWPPGSTAAYHPLSHGHLAGEVLRRVDGRTMGTFVAEEISRPLGMEFYIGLPEAEDGRAAETIVGPGTTDPIIEAEDRPLARIGYLNPRFPVDIPNQRPWRAAEIPAANGHGDAIGLAKLYGALAQGGSLDGARLLGRGTLAAATEERFRGNEAGFDRPMAFGAGFMLNVDHEFGPSDAAFGHSGWGGSFAYADPDAGLGVAYVMNRMLGFGDRPDPRRLALLDALYSAL
ncbi:MAG: serine hydrolase domain-containing protein [Pseudomonadota bacterium]|nr:serine hydrolase domain-containing protein [Pseudomonadota bacterium]